MNTEGTLRFWSSVPLFAIGCLLGMLLLLSMRVLYYDWMDYRPNMHPGIAFVGLPVLFPIVLALALPVEALLQRYISKSSGRLQAFSIGIIGASVVSWWAFPLHWYVTVVLNPFMLRWVVPGMRRVRPNKTIEPTR
jgi:hypothetical protein